MPLKMTVVRNPAAGRGAVGRHWSAIESRLMGNSTWNVLVVDTTGPGEATRIAADACQAGADAVVACGGDGTIMEVMSGIVGRGPALGFLPFGTGNDFCRTLGIGKDAARAVDVLLANHVRSVDVGRWQCDTRAGMFLNVAGCGFDAVVAERINRGYRRLRGTSAYLAAVLQTLAAYRPVQIRVRVDDQTIATDAMLCAIANAQSYGGGMRIAPSAAVDDGLLDVVIVQGVSKAEFLRTFPKVFSGTHISHPRVLSMRGRKVRIESDTPLPLLADGEQIGLTPVSFTIEPAALRILAP